MRGSCVKKPILVVGSRPRFTIPDIAEFDVGIFANSSIVRANAFKCRETVHFVSRMILEDADSILLRLARERCAGNTVDKLVICGNYNKDHAKSLEKMKYCARSGIEYFTYDDVFKAVASHLDLRCMIKILNNGDGTLRSILRACKHKIVSGCPLRLKPSTGLSAILWAMRRRRSNNQDIIVSGIGLDQSGYDYTDVVVARGHEEIDEALVLKLGYRGVHFLDV